jgi:hypothetical protein
VSARSERWFVTTNESRVVTPEGGMTTTRSGALVHAKRMGSMATACGLSAETWIKLYQLEFPTRGVTNCRECMRAVYDVERHARAAAG